MLKRDINNALKKIYATETKIERFNGDKIDAKDAYINLAIVEKAEITKVNNKNKQSSSFEQMYNARRAINLNELFIDEVSYKKPHRVLIKGAAGVGKTSFCKYLCRQYSISSPDLNISNISWVFWLPFRGITSYKPYDGDSIEKTIATAIYRYYFAESNHLKKYNKNLVIKALAEVLKNSNEALLILDGFDEIADDFYPKPDKKEALATRIYRALLNYPHSIVVTRPNCLSRLPNKNRVLELENIGFTIENILNYVKKFYNDKKLEKSIIDNKKTLAMFHIPLNLDLFCNAYFANKAKDLNTTCNSLTKLYTTVVQNILDARGKKLKIDSNPNQLSAFMAYMQNFFGLLSFKKMQSQGEEAHIIKSSDIGDVIKICNENAKKYWDKNTIKSLAKDVANVGFLVKIYKRNKVKSHQFLHFTFQEYFAAKYLADSLEDNKNKDAIRFIDKNKYKKRCKTIFLFISGILSKGSPKPLHIFLSRFINSQTVPNAEKDIYKDALHFRILNEILTTEDFSEDYKVKKLINLWIISTNHSIFAKIKEYSPNKLFVVYDSIALSQELFYKYGLMQKLLTGIKTPITGLGYYFSKQKDINTLQKKIIISLGLIGLKHRNIENSLARFIRDKELQAITAQSLIQLGNSSTKIVKVLIKTAHQDNFLISYLGRNKWGSSEAKFHINFCNALKKVLIQQSKLEKGSLEFTNNLFKILEAIYDDNLFQILLNLNTNNKLFEFKKQLLFIKYKTDVSVFSIKRLLFLAACLLKTKSLKPTIIQDMRYLSFNSQCKKKWFAILKNWKNELSLKDLQQYMSNIAILFASQKTIINLLIGLKNTNEFTKTNSALVLANLGKVEGKAIAILVDHLNSKDPSIRIETALALINLGKVEDKAIAILMGYLNGKDPSIRIGAALALVNLGKVEDKAIAILMGYLNGKDPSIRIGAALALVNLGKVEDKAIAILVDYLNDRSKYVRRKAARALVKLGKLENAAISIILKALNHRTRRNDEKLNLIQNTPTKLYDHGCENIGNIIIAIFAIIMLKKNSFIKSKIVEALGTLRITSLIFSLPRLKDPYNSMIKHNKLREGLYDAYCGFIFKAVSILWNMSKGNHSRLINKPALANEFYCLIIRTIAMLIGKTLVSYFYKPEKNLDMGLWKPVYSWKFGINNKVIGAIFNPIHSVELAMSSKHSKTIIDSLIKILDGKNYNDRRDAATVLAMLSSSEEVVISLMNLLSDKNHNVRRDSALALVKIGKNNNSSRVLFGIEKLLNITDNVLSIYEALRIVNMLLDNFEVTLPWLLKPNNNPEANIEKLLYIADKVYQKRYVKYNIINVADYIKEAKYSNGEIVEIKDASFNFDKAKIIVAALITGKFKPVTINIVGDIESNGLDKLLPLLSLDKPLEGLNVRINFDKLKTYDYDKISTKLKSAKYPERLYISSNNIDNLESLAKNNKKLILPVTELDVSNSNKVNSLISLKDKLPYLIDLKLNNNKLDLKSAIAIAKFFPRVKILDLKSNYISLSKRGLKKLSHKGMTNIYLGQNYIKNADKIFTKENNGFYHYNIFKTKLRSVPSRLNPNIKISKDKWICALVCKKNLNQSMVYVGHSMIFMEGMGSYGQRFLRRFHIEGVKLEGERIAKLAKVDETIDIHKYSLKNYHINAKPISSSQGKLLQKKVEADFGKKLPFDMYFAEAKGKSKFNCLKWCKDKLTQAKIGVNTNNRWVPIKAARDKNFFI